MPFFLIDLCAELMFCKNITEGSFAFPFIFEFPVAFSAGHADASTTVLAGQTWKNDELHSVRKTGAKSWEVSNESRKAKFEVFKSSSIIKESRNEG